MLRSMLVLSVMFMIQANIHAQDSLPESVRKEFNAYVGVWKGSLELDGEKTPVKWTASWAPGNQCLIIHEEYNVGGQPSKITALMGYDRIQEHVTNLGFRTDGGNRTLTYADKCVSGKGTGDSPDGKTWKSDFKIEKNGNEWAFIFDGTSPEAKDFVIRLQKARSEN